MRLFSFFNPARHAFDARYRRYSGEAYAIYQPNPVLSLQLSYRVVQVRLTSVTDVRVTMRVAPILRYEPMLFCRLRPAGLAGAMQLQGAIGWSSVFGSIAGDDFDSARQFWLNCS